MLTENDRLNGFIADVYSEVLERLKEAEKESSEKPEDLFLSGRSLAFLEIKDIIDSRLSSYEIQLEE